MRVRRHLIRLHLTLRSLDIPIFHTELAGGFSSSSRPLSPYPLSCLYHGLSGHSRGQSKCQRRYLCEWCRLWEGEEDRGGQCLHAWHGPTSSFGDQTTISLCGGERGESVEAPGRRRGSRFERRRPNDNQSRRRGGKLAEAPGRGGGSRFEGRRPNDNQPWRSAEKGGNQSRRREGGSEYVRDKVTK